MRTPKVSTPFNANPNKSTDQIRELAEGAPDDAKAFAENLRDIYKQGVDAYGWSDALRRDADEILNDGQLKPGEVYPGRPAFEVYETRRLGPATKAQYVSGELVVRDNKLILKMDGGRELRLAVSGRKPHDHRGELRQDFIGGFVAAPGETRRVRLKGTLGSDGRFNVEFAVPERKGWEKFEQGRLYFNREADNGRGWVELQTPRGNVVITDPTLLEHLTEILKTNSAPSIGVILPGEAKPGEQGGLVYDTYPGGGYWLLGGYARMHWNLYDGRAPDTKITYAHFGFSTAAGVPVIIPAKQKDRVQRNTDRQDGFWGPDQTNGRFWVLGEMIRGERGEIGIMATELSEQTDRFWLEGDPASDADGAEVVKTFGAAEELDETSRPLLSTRKDGW